MSFTIFALTSFSMVNDYLEFIDFLLVFRNAIVICFLANGIGLCAIHFGSIKGSNSVTMVSAMLISMLLVNIVADINNSYEIVLGLSLLILFIGIGLTVHLAQKIDEMEI